MNIKKLLGIVLIFALLILGSMAFAADVPDISFNAPTVKSDRVALMRDEVSAYLEGDLSYSESNGLFKIKINDTESDWEQILAHGGSAPFIDLSLCVKNPDPSKYHIPVSFNGNLCDEEYMQEYILQDILQYHMEEIYREVTRDDDPPSLMDLLNNMESQDWTHSQEIGEIIREQSMLVPLNDWDVGNLRGAYIGWFNAGELYNIYVDCDYDQDAFMAAAIDKVKFEYFWSQVIHNQEDAFYIPLRYASKHCLVPSASVNQETGVSFDGSGFNDDSVTFIIDTDKIPEENVEVEVKLRLPKALEGYADMLTLYSRDFGSESFDLEEDGTFSFFIDYNGEEARADERSYVVAWQRWDSETQTGITLDYGQFFVYLIPKDLRPWPGYVGNQNRYNLTWTPVPATRVVIQDDNSGAKLSYDEKTGIFNVGFDRSAKITGELSNVYVSVKPPEGAVWYRTNRSGGNLIMGEDMWAAEDMDSYILNPPPTGNPEEDIWPKQGNVRIRDYPTLREVNAGPVTVYLQNEAVWKYGGSVNTIYWYDSFDADPEKPMKIEYICETFDEMSIAVENPCIENEADITEPVTQITGVGKSCKNWKLVIRYDLQSGHNALHYDLHMKNDTGAYQILKEPLVFYIPYPSGTSYESGHFFELLHFNDSYTSHEKVTVTPTPYGLRFVVDSLSPFTLSWNDGTNGAIGESTPAPLPPTGDNAPIMLWSLLLAVSLCGMILLGRKQRAK